MSSTLPPLQAFEERFCPSKVPAGYFSDPNDILLFMHIPKTAGMSVGKALQEYYDVFRPVAWENVGQSFRKRSREALYARSISPKRQVIMGHFSWADVMFWRNQELPIKLATIVRDPLERFVSNYNYNCSPRHPNHAIFRERFPSMEHFAHQLGHDFQLTTMIGAFYSFDHALEQLTRYYSFIGVTEQLGDSLAHFRRSHGLEGDTREHRENAAPTPTRVEEVNDAVRNIVLERSHNDLKLHALVATFYR